MAKEQLIRNLVMKHITPHSRSHNFEILRFNRSIQQVQMGIDIQMPCVFETCTLCMFQVTLWNVGCQEVNARKLLTKKR